MLYTCGSQKFSWAMMRDGPVRGVLYSVAVYKLGCSNTSFVFCFLSSVECNSQNFTAVSYSSGVYEIFAWYKILLFVFLVLGLEH